MGETHSNFSRERGLSHILLAHGALLIIRFRITLFAESKYLPFLLKSTNGINQCRIDIWEEKCGTVKL